MKSSIRTLLVLTCALLVGSLAIAGSLCNDPLHPNNVCLEMKNLRSHIMMLEAQRDLLQLNYPYMRGVSDSLANVARSVKNKLPAELQNHAPALQAIANQGDQMARLSETLNPNIFVVSNTLRANCAACHNNEGSPSGRRWEDVFKMDWTKIVEKCNTPGRNPFICKQMHGMISNYSYILSAFVAGIENYDMTEKAAGEIARISKTLIENNFLHERGDLILDVHNKAKEAAEAARMKDPTAFEKAYGITESCNKCHNAMNARGPQAANKSNFNIWN